MAVCSELTPCAICGKQLGDLTDVIGFPDLVPMFSDFGDFYDACAHSQCMKDWPRRDEFVQYFNSLAESSTFPGRWHLVVLPDGRVTYRAPHEGPNNSFKPNPLRGSA